MEKPTFDPEELIVSFNDVKRLYISMKRKLAKWAVIGGVLSFLYFGHSTPKYKAEATFKEGVEKGSPDHFIKEMIIGMAPANQPQASSLMKSYQVLRPLVEKMGLQVTCAKSEWALKRIFKKFKETLKAEKGLPLDDPDSFEFQNVLYEGEKVFLFNAVFSDPTHFTVYSEDRKKEICNGVVGEEVRLEDPPVQLTLVKTPKKLKCGIFYPFQASHWTAAAGGLRGQLKIVSDKLNTSIYSISITNRDRHLSTRLVNEVMAQYQSYLKREYDQTAKEQLSYLENKQTQIVGKMEDLFDQHTAYVVRNVEKNGFFGMDQEAQSLLIPHQEMQKKVMAIDVELSRLEQIEKEGKVVAVAEEGPFSRSMNQISQTIQDLKLQRDQLELSLSSSGVFNENSLDARKEELKKVRSQRFEVEKLIQEIDQGGEIASFDVNPGLALWAATVENPEEREDLAEYLDNYSRLLSLREKMLQERFFYGTRAPKELEGIDLASAKNLFLGYNSKLDLAEAAMRHHKELKKEVLQPDFDLASLSSILIDPLCQKIIAEASALGLQIKDEKHHSPKEEERWREEISLHRKILSDHLEQLYKVEELNSALIRDKMEGLRKLSLDCINQQISVLHEQAYDSIKQRRQALHLEKDLLEKKMEEIRKALAQILPEKWRFEKWLAIKTNMVSKVMETVTEVVESKTMANHMHHVESKPLDRALTPSFPVPPRLYLKTCLGAFALSFLVFSLAFIRRILKGFPITLEKLQALRIPVLGTISAFCDGPSVETPTGPDLEILRGLALFSEGGKVISLIGGRGPDYSSTFAENLARMSVRSIVVRCDFLSKFRKEDCPGILQVWNREIAELPIRKGKGFDFITSGGYSPFGTEIIQSQSFAQLIEVLKQNYDWVFLLFRSPLASAESAAALRHCDKAIVTISGEQTEELTPFVNWGYDEDRCRITFIATS